MREPIKAFRLMLLALPVFLAVAGAGAWAAPPIDPNEARPEVEWKDADKVVGKVAAVLGKVVRVGQSETMRFVDFDTERPARFQVVIRKENWPAFTGDVKELYEGKIVRVRGMVTTFQERPQIQVTAPAQIDVLAEVPPVKAAARKAWSGDEVTVATYNILNLFDDQDDIYHQDEGTPAKPRDEMQRVAESIRKINPDVIAFQEVESRGYLERFIEVFLGDMGYDHVVHFEGNDHRGIDVCLASRLPVGVVRSHRHVLFPGPDGKPTQFERDLLCATIEPPGADPFEVWVVHLKSNFGGREAAEPVRIAEAMQVHKIIDDRLKKEPNLRFAIVGDFNDTFESTTLKSIVGSGGTGLVCTGAKLLEDKQISYNQKPYLTMIDFILASPAMGARYVADSCRIDPGSPETTGSDHNPVSARFKVK